MKCLFHSVVSILLGLCSLAWSQAPNLEAMDIVTKSIPDGPVARVGKTNIEKIDFILLYQSELNSFVQQNPSIELVDGNRVRIALLCINILLEEELLYQEAVLAKLTIDRDQATRDATIQIERLRAAFSKQAGRDVLETEILKRLGYSDRTEVEREVERKMLIEAMRAQIIAERSETVSEETVRAAYEKRKAEMVLPMRLHLRRISISADRRDDAARQAGLAKAKQALDKIYAGQRFETVAEEFSDLQDPERGSDLGMIPAANLPPAMVKATESMELGDVSEILEGESGVHIIQLVAREASGSIPEDKAMAMIERALEREQNRLVVREYCDHLVLGGANVRVFLELEQNLARISDRQSLETE